MIAVIDSRLIEDRTDLSHGPCSDAVFLQMIQYGIFRQGDTVIMALAGPVELSRFPVEGAGDYTSHRKGITELPGNFTQTVEFPDRVDIPVSGNLKNRVSRAVADGKPVFRCSSPSSSIITVPLAALLPSMPPQPVFFMNSSMRASGKVGYSWGNRVNGLSRQFPPAPSVP